MNDLWVFIGSFIGGAIIAFIAWKLGYAQGIARGYQRASEVFLAGTEKILALRREYERQKVSVPEEPKDGQDRAPGSAP